MIVITRDELVSLGACDPGLTWFDTHAPTGRVEFPGLTALRVWAGLRGGGPYVRWLLTDGDKSQRGADLAGANLSLADLTGTHLVGADLAGANLRCAQLVGANLAGADLSGADLSGANLEGAGLVVADLSGASLARANLEGARLTHANLEGARLTGADLADADLEGANLMGAVRLPADPPIPGWETYIDGNVTRLRRTT